MPGTKGEARRAEPVRPPGGLFCSVAYSTSVGCTLPDKAADRIRANAHPRTGSALWSGKITVLNIRKADTDRVCENVFFLVLLRQAGHGARPFRSSTLAPDHALALVRA